MVRVIVQLLKVLTIAVAAILVATGGLRVFDFAVGRATPEDVGERVEVAISDDDSEEELADRLADEGVIRSAFFFANAVKFSGRTLEAGEYTLTKGMTVPEIVDRVTGVQQAAEAPEGVGGGNVGVGPRTETFEATIVEGWRIEQIAEYFGAESKMENGAEAFREAVANVDRSNYEFLADLPADAPLEGFLFPNTYDFVTDQPAYNVELMLNGFDAQFTPDMRERAAEMNLSLQQVLILASLVEREAKVPDERPIIADVYIKRWEQQADGWKLDADPTVQYVVGPRDGEWWPELRGDDLFVESPYNTYQNPGLPPSPICSPSLASIQAVLFPDDTPYYFFVATGDESGTHYFAATAEEQAANVEKYREAVGDD